MAKRESLTKRYGENVHMNSGPEEFRTHKKDDKGKILKKKIIHYNIEETQTPDLYEIGQEDNKSSADAVRFGIVIASVAVCMILIIAAWNMGRKHVALEDYVTIKYTGADGYAVAECVIDEDGIVNMLIAKDSDDSKEYIYRQFTRSLSGSVSESADKGISNGDRLKVEMTYDKELARSAGISVGSSTFNVRAKGIDAGTKIDLFENLEVIFAGISPDAYVVTRNLWEDEFLSQLSFTADKSSGIVVNDEITIHCDVDEDELGRHGYLVDTCDKSYAVDRLSSYIDTADQIDSAVLAKNMKLCTEAITADTEDSSFRMLYKATQDKSYLYLPNEESADNITLAGMQFLKRTGTASTDIPKNKIVLVYTADISCSDAEESVYFAFVFENGYVTADGEFNVLNSSDGELKYYCGVDYESVMLEVFDGDENNYTVLDLT